MVKKVSSLLLLLHLQNSFSIMLKPFRCHNYSVACELPSVYVNKEATWKLKKTQIFFSLIRGCKRIFED